MSAPSTISGRSGRVDRELFEGEGGAQIGESAECGANLQQAGFGAFVGGKGIEFVATDGAEQHGVGVERRGECVGGQRGAVLHDGDAADALCSDCELVAAKLRDFLQTPRRLRW